MDIEATNDFLSDNFDYNDLQPLTALKLTLPSREEISVAKKYPLDNEDKSKRETILQKLMPVATVFRDTYRLFEAIETSGSSTTINESLFSALSRIDTIRRSSMTDQRDLSFERKKIA